MGRKREAGAVERVVLEAIGASGGDLHAHDDIQQLVNGKGEHKVTAGQVRKAVKWLRNAGFVEAVGRGRGVQHRITEAGKRALSNGDLPAAPAREKPQRGRSSARRGKRAAVKRKTTKTTKPRTSRLPYHLPNGEPLFPPSEDADRPIAAFTAKGEVIVSRGSITKRLDVDESREVIALVRAFDGAGLLPQAEAA